MTGLKMAKPVLIGRTYYLRVAVPSDVVGVASGKPIALPIGTTTTRVKAGTHVKVSLGTKDPKEAKQRFTGAYDALLRHWEGLRCGPQSLSHKQCVALAGEVRAIFVSVFDDNPGDAKLWEDVQRFNEDAEKLRLPRFAELMVGPLPPPSNTRTMEERWGGFTDVTLLKHQLIVDEATRWKLLVQIADAMKDVPRINQRKARGDYSDTGETDRFPEYKSAERVSKALEAAPMKLTFDEVISTREKRRAAGKDSKPLPADTVRKYRMQCKDFATYRGSNDLTTVTPQEIDSWMQAMVTEAKRSNSTIGQYVQNVGTVLTWANRQSFGQLYPKGNPAGLVERPEVALVDSAETTLRLDEAEAILRAARLEARPELRWGPWIMAYSGARIEEVAQLRREDFFQHSGSWFYHLHTKGKRTLKGKDGIRRVPVHPDLVAEGLIAYVQSVGPPETTALFSGRMGPDLRAWVREGAGVKRTAAKPNHGWRHLFEDMAIAMPDDAKHYVTGRATGKSGEGYGKSDAMLPSLAELMRGVRSYLKD